MECTVLEIPSYLHYTNGRKKYNPSNFRFYHLLFITGHKEKQNPIEFPQTITSISTCWSKLISPKHVLKVVRGLAKNPDGRGDNVYYNTVKQIQSFKVSAVYEGADYPGKHILTTETWHTPLACNYSHSEIMIKHIYTEKGIKKVEVITKEQFESKKCLIRKNSHKEFFKPLLLEYRSKMATHFNNDIKELDVPIYLRLFPKHVLVRLALWKATVLRA